MWRLGRQSNYGIVAAQLKLRPRDSRSIGQLIGGLIYPRRLCSSRQRRVLLNGSGPVPYIWSLVPLRHSQGRTG